MNNKKTHSFSSEIEWANGLVKTAKKQGITKTELINKYVKRGLKKDGYKNKLPFKQNKEYSKKDFMDMSSRYMRKIGVEPGTDITRVKYMERFYIVNLSIDDFNQSIMTVRKR